MVLSRTGPWVTARLRSVQRWPRNGADDMVRSVEHDGELIRMAVLLALQESPTLGEQLD